MFIQYSSHVLSAHHHIIKVYIFVIYCSLTQQNNINTPNFTVTPSQTPAQLIALLMNKSHSHLPHTCQPHMSHATRDPGASVSRLSRRQPRQLSTYSSLAPTGTHIEHTIKTNMLLYLCMNDCARVSYASYAGDAHHNFFSRITTQIAN